jgi:hypothetical protein
VEEEDETQHWPIATEHREYLDAIKDRYRIRPLAVYTNDDVYIEPCQVLPKMRDALVEVYFRLKHYRIGSGAAAFDSFSGIIEQIIILQEAGRKSSTPYNHIRSNLKGGPYKPKVDQANNFVQKMFANSVPKAQVAIDKEAGPSTNRAVGQDTVSQAVRTGLFDT